MNIKSLKIGSKKTVGIRIFADNYRKIEHLFDEQGRPKKGKLSYGFNGYKWTLFRGKPIIDVEGVNHGYNIYGVCGDFTFGNIPWFYNITNCGNIRAGKSVYKNFLEEYYEQYYNPIT